MKTILKFTGLTIIIALIAFLCYVKFILPTVGEPENIKVTLEPERIERGRYLANSVAVCMDCHSTRDWSKYSGPLVENTLGKGGEEFSQEIGFPGKYYAKNITPAALNSWTDGEILRAIASGVNRDGDALFPIMPHPSYGNLDREDLYSIIAYLRTLPPIVNEVSESKSDFPMNFIINSIPQKANYSTIPNTSDKLAYGEYLFKAAACADCHTQQNKGKPIAGMELAGGFKFPLKTGGTVSSANITPDKETGIGNWSQEDFIDRFKYYADSSYLPEKINNGDFNTVMPWIMYSSMKTKDIEAIFEYLQSVKPVNNRVTLFIPDKIN